MRSLTATTFLVLALSSTTTRAAPEFDPGTIGGISVEMGSGLEAVEKALGKPASRSVPVEDTELHRGHQTWTYAGGVTVEISTKAMVSEFRAPFSVWSVTAVAPSKLALDATKLGVGSARADVEKAYGKHVDKKRTSDAVITLHGSPTVRFTFARDKVTKIAVTNAYE